MASPQTGCDEIALLDRHDAIVQGALIARRRDVQIPRHQLESRRVQGHEHAALARLAGHDPIEQGVLVPRDGQLQILGYLLERVLLERRADVSSSPRPEEVERARFGCSSSTGRAGADFGTIV